jgi:hypothetical protein
LEIIQDILNERNDIEQKNIEPVIKENNNTEKPKEILLPVGVLLRFLFYYLLLFIPYTYIANHYLNGSGYMKMTRLAVFYYDRFGWIGDAIYDLDFTNFNGYSLFAVIVLELIIFLLLYRNWIKSNRKSSTINSQ